MLSTFTKKIIGMEKLVHPTVYRDNTGKSQLIIYKGYEPHYQWFQQNQAKFQEDSKIYCFDRCSIDLALEMAFRNTSKLSYISTRNYQTVVAIHRQSGKTDNQEQEKSQEKPTINKKGLFKKGGLQRQSKQTDNEKKQSIDNNISQKAKYILNSCDFAIKNTFLDIHPLQAYQKICGYLMVRSNPDVLRYFQGFKCSQQPLLQSFHLLPILNQLRKSLLIDNQLKVQYLQRKPSVRISNQMISDYIRRWQEKVRLNVFKDSICSFNQRQKIDWVIANHLGEEISKREVLNQKYRRFSYAILT